MDPYDGALRSPIVVPITHSPKQPYRKELRFRSLGFPGFVKEGIKDLKGM